MGMMHRSEAFVTSIYKLNANKEFTLMLNIASRAFHDGDNVSVYVHYQDNVQYLIFEDDRANVAAYVDARYISDRYFNAVPLHYDGTIESIDALMKDVEEIPTWAVHKYSLNDRSNHFFSSHGDDCGKQFDHIGKWKARAADKRPSKYNNVRIGHRASKAFKATKPKKGRVSFKLMMLNLVAIVEDLYLFIDDEKLGQEEVLAKFTEINGKYHYFSFDETNTCITLEMVQDGNHPFWVAKVQSDCEIIANKLASKWFSEDGSMKDVELFEENILNAQ